MSWLSDNYEKAALGGAAVVAVALGAVAFSNKGALAEAFSLNTPKQNKETDVKGYEDMNDVKASLAEVHEVLEADVNGRKVDLFTGVPLFAKRGDLQNPVDLLTSPAVHQGIENTWWLKYDVDPGFSDSPERDPDKDGFTNREEHDAGTDPSEFKNHPNPVHKLVTLSVKTSQIHIKPTNFGGGQSVFKIETKNGNRKNRMQPNPIGAGKVIPFIEPFMQNRFKFKAFRQEQKPNGIPEDLWDIEDLKPNKAGTVYTFDKRGNLPGAAKREFGVMDYTVEFSLQAIGQGGNPFKLEENNRFSLPFDPKAAKKPYLLKKVDAAAQEVHVEYTDAEGNVKTHIMKFKKR